MTTLQIVGLILFGVLVIQWALAFVCLMRLYRNKPRRLKMWQWNLIVLFGILFGPVLYFILEKPNPRVLDKDPNSGEDGGDYSI